MNRKEQMDAVRALLAWFESQEISLHDAAPILSVALVSVIFNLAQEYDRDPDVGMRLMADGMVKAMQMRPKQ